MKKRKKRPADPKQNLTVVVLAIVVVLLLIATVSVIVFIETGRMDPQQTDPAGETQSVTEASPPTEPKETVTASLPTEQTEASVGLIDQLPYVLENGKLEIDSLFQYSGLNPDCDWADGTNIGAVVLVNTSEEYLESLDMTITMTDGTVLHFLIWDIPAGKTVWAYDTDNTPSDAAAVIENVQYEAVFAERAGLVPEQVAVSVEGIDATLTNLTDAELNGLEMRCHSILEGAYFGGTSYAYAVETIAAGASVTLSAVDCFLGETEVTLVDYTN